MNNGQTIKLFIMVGIGMLANVGYIIAKGITPMGIVLMLFDVAMAAIYFIDAVLQSAYDDEEEFSDVFNEVYFGDK